MPTWVKMKRVDLGYRDPRTGRKLQSIEGRQNRPGVDPFDHIGWKYPPGTENALSRHEQGEDVLVLMNTPSVGAQAITDTQALEELKVKHRFPSQTFLGADQKPIIPKEKADEKSIPHH